MDQGVLSLPSDTWYEIAELLDVGDIFNLRKVNRQLYGVFSSNRLWKPLSKDRWFSIDDQPSVMLNDVQDCCSYYRNRNRTDLEIRKLLAKIADSDDSKEIFETSWNVIRMNYRAIPILNELKLKAEALDIKFYAFALLMSIRHSEVYHTLKNLKNSDLGTAISAEEFFFQMSYIDPAFDNLLPFRKKVIEEVLERVQKHPNYKETAPPSYKVLLIRTVLLQVIEKSPLIEGKECIEDNFLLRVYAGESNGKKIILESIIQKIASYFDIKSTLTESFLIVEDETFTTGQSYVLLTEARAKIFSYGHIMRTLRLSAENLNKLLLPLTTKQLVKAILDDAESPLYTMFDSSDYKTIYRHSKASITTDTLFLFELYKDGVFSESLRDKYAIDTHLQMLGNTIRQVLFRSMPFDLIHIRDHGCFDKQFTYEDFKEKLVNDYYKFEHFDLQSEDTLNIPSADQKPELKIGDVVYHERMGDYGIILGHKSTKNTVYYNIFTDFGDPRLYEAKSLKRIETIPQNLYYILTREAWVGLFFKHFDEKENRFVPTKHLLKLFPNY